MFRISIKNLAVNIVVAALVLMLASCASMPSLKKPTTASKATAKTERSAEASSSESAGKSAGKILAQPDFRISKKTAAAYNQALKHMRAKNYDTAIVEMQKVAQMDERISGPWVNMGMAYKNLSNVDKARTSFNKALKINPNNPFALNQLAIMNREEGKFELAEKLYMKALSTYPDYKNAHLNLAILCDVYLRKIDCALGHYQKYLNLSGGQDKQVTAWMTQLEKQGS